MDQPIKQQLVMPAVIAFGVGAALTWAVWLWVENGPAILLQLVASSAAFLCL